MGHTVAALSQPRHYGPRPAQLAYFGEQARQHLSLGHSALGKQVMVFDRLEDRLRGAVSTPNTARSLSCVRARPALSPPARSGFVGMPNQQLLRRRIGEGGLASAKPRSWATCSINALTSSTPSLPKAV